MAKYIELEVAVKAFNNFDAGRADSPPCTLLTPEEFAEYLYELPTADVAPVVHGRWISFLDGDHIMPERYYVKAHLGSALGATGTSLAVYIDRAGFTTMDGTVG